MIQVHASRMPRHRRIRSLGALQAVFTTLVTAAPSSAWAFELNSDGYSHLCWFSDDPASDWYILQGSPYHAGDDSYADDWNMQQAPDLDCGEPVHPACDGEVIYTGDVSNGYGNQVVIRCSADRQFVVRVAHLQSISVSKGQFVTHADTIGEVGETGTASGCHLHLVLYKNISDGSTALARLTGGRTPSGALQGSASEFAAWFLPDDDAC